MKSLVIVSVAAIFLFTAQVTFGQLRLSDAVLVKTIDKSVEDVGESVDNLSLELKSMMNLKEDWIAMRICSQLPLPIAINLVQSSPYHAALQMNSYGIPLENIIYLREDNCVSPQNLSTEFWLVRKDGELPSFIESRKATNLLIEEFTYSDVRLDVPHNGYDKPRDRVNTENYPIILSKVIDKLKADKNALVLVRYPIKHPQKSVLMKSIAMLKKMLKDSKINSNRIFVKTRLYFSEQSYPDIDIISET